MSSHLTLSQPSNPDSGAGLAPLVVDLDGTLTPTDTLVESAISAIKHSPWVLLLMPFWLLLGRAGLKNRIAAHARIAADALPYRAPLLTYLGEQKAKGRRIVLATAAHHSVADSVAAHLQLFDMVIASDAALNLKGEAKLQAIRERVGARFAYAGDSSADLPIWREAESAVLVGASRATAAKARTLTAVEQEFPNESVGPKIWLRALRVHQWVKNVLLFVPVFTAFSFLDLNNLFKVTLAFLAFSLSASATYIVNDLLDLDNDRRHPRKCTRPFASAAIAIPHGVVVAIGLLATGIALAWSVTPGFFAMLLVYLVMTSAYSWVLKTYVLIDVIMLSLLYTLRILAGSAALSIAASSWLLAFSAFLFLSLALVKRCAELVSLQQEGKLATNGRDYRVSDLTVLWPFGVASALSAIVVFGLFLYAPETQERYATVELLWLVAIGLIYWLARLWLKTARGEMHDDPLVFALKDGASRLVALAMGAFVLFAHFFEFSSLS